MVVSLHCKKTKYILRHESKPSPSVIQTAVYSNQRWNNVWAINMKQDSKMFIRAFPVLQSRSRIRRDAVCTVDMAWLHKPSNRIDCLFMWASAASHGCTAACWLIVPPAFDVQTLATRCPRAYRRVPHSSGGSWNLWAENKDREFCLSADIHGTFRYLLHAAHMQHGFTSLPKEGVMRIFPPLKNPTQSVGFEPANVGTRGQHANP
jgi:hypothetical protein